MNLENMLKMLPAQEDLIKSLGLNKTSIDALKKHCTQADTPPKLISKSSFFGMPIKLCNALPDNQMVIEYHNGDIALYNLSTGEMSRRIECSTFELPELNFNYREDANTYGTFRIK